MKYRCIQILPLVIKADLNHKTDLGAVKLNIQNYSELKKYYEEFKKKFNTDIINTRISNWRI
ncbi:hypothetical protein [Candidatus Nanopusillus massiliensis]|uniref:hypothetical protein n=1 Tax=Candidatus Nanopusillus massiliensis TaxID=2897163 RepID=UPI001E5B9F4D|nr:hypothetical protein [Candidatus Nanopusillus massiliensis]